MRHSITLMLTMAAASCAGTTAEVATVQHPTATPAPQQDEGLQPAPERSVRPARTHPMVAEAEVKTGPVERFFLSFIIPSKDWMELHAALRMNGAAVSLYHKATFARLDIYVYDTSEGTPEEAARSIRNYHTQHGMDADDVQVGPIGDWARFSFAITSPSGEPLKGRVLTKRLAARRDSSVALIATWPRDEDTTMARDFFAIGSSLTATRPKDGRQ